MTIYALHDYDNELKKKGCFPIDKAQAGTMNEMGYGIFFTPNKFLNGKRIEENLQELRFWYVDMDKGSKELMTEKILQFPLVPSQWVETHKGYHVYWRCEKGLVEDEMVGDYLKVLSGLVNWFDGDENAMGVNRVLRVPNFYHCKDPRNKFLVTDVFSCEQIYTVEEMLSVLPDEKVNTVVDERRGSFFSQVSSTDDFWSRVYDLDCFECLPILSGSPECNGESFHVERVGSKGKIYVNGDLVQSCWIDPDGKIGSHANGGPTLANWVKWYGHSWDTVAKCLKAHFPMLNQEIKIPCTIAKW